MVVCGARCEGAGPGCRGRPGGGVRGGGISGACCRLPGRLPAAARCRQLPRQPVAPQGAHGTAPRPTRAAARGQHAHTCPRPVQQGHTCAGSGQQAHTCTCPEAAGPDLRPHVCWPWAAGPGCWRCVMLSVPAESCSPSVVQRGLFGRGAEQLAGAVIPAVAPGPPHNFARLERCIASHQQQMRRPMGAWTAQNNPASRILMFAVSGAHKRPDV